MRFVLFGVVVLAVALLMACGGGDDADPTATVASGDPGEFVVNPAASAQFPCSSDHSIPVERALGEDVYSANFDPASEVEVCPDGTVVSITDAGDEVMGRRLYVGEPIVSFDAPADRIVTLEVKGCPAIMQEPSSDTAPDRRIAAIERAPSGEDAGVMVWIDNTALSEAQAIAYLDPFVTACAG